MLGEKLMRLRKKQGYSQQEVADKLSVSRQTISNWECDQALPAVAYLLDISTSDGKVLIVDVNDDWVKVQYHRTKKGSFIKKETVTKLIDLSCISGFKVEGEL